MGRMHTRKKGKSGSTRPSRKNPPEWMKRSPEWVEEKVVELAKIGTSQSMIGLILRDQYGVPLVNQIAGKSISQILKENSLGEGFPEDLMNLMRQAVKIRRHIEEHKKDLHGKFGLQKIEAKIHRLSKYYRSNGVIDPSWKYKPAEAALLVR
ncbi:MAG: 30S ribosomal protein S15 [Candidatus Ranarchaeia archaeon]